MPRKPPQKSRVVALRGDFVREVVTQADLIELSTAQRAEWMASKRAALLSEGIKASLQQGARVEPGPLYFDRELEMVRSKKKEDVG